MTSESQVDLVEGYPKQVASGVREYTFENLEHSANYRITVTSLKGAEEGPHSYLVCAVTHAHSEGETTDPVDPVVETKPVVS